MVHDGIGFTSDMISNFDFQFNSYFILIQAQRFGYQLKSQKLRIGDSITDGAILKVEGSHRRNGDGGQERRKAEVKTKTKTTPSATTRRRTSISCNMNSPRGG